MTDPIEPADDLEFGESGATTGFRTFGEEFSKEEEPSPSEGEPEDEGTKDDEGAEEEPGEEEDEGEPGDEEPEEEHGLPKVSKELEEERNNLLRMVSDKMKGVGALKIKAQLVDAIHENPEETIKMLADRYGIDFGKGEEEPSEISFDFTSQDVAPQKDEELHSYVGRLVQANLLPVVDSIKKLVKGGTPKPAAKGKVPGAAGEETMAIALKHLDDNYTDWGLYEDRMVALVTKHPSLMNDPDELYKMAKATSANIRDVSKQKRVAKKKAKSGERSSKVVKIRTGKGKKMGFNEAWERAKTDLRG